MSIEDIMHKIESDYDCKIIYCMEVGSNTLNANTPSSDKDYLIVTDFGTPVGLHDTEDNIDVWVANINNMFMTYPFIHICNIGNADNIIYFYNDNIKNFILLNKEAIQSESLNYVYNATLNNIEFFKSMGEEKYNEQFRKNSSIMRDTLLALIILKNNYYKNPLKEITKEESQFLRDIRGKDTVTIPYKECLLKIDELFDKKLLDYYSSKVQSNFDITKKLYNLIGENMNIEPYVNRYNLLLTLHTNGKYEKLNYFNNDFNDRDKIEYINTIIDALYSKYNEVSDSYIKEFNKIVSILGLSDKIPSELMNNLFNLFRHNDLSKWNDCITAVLNLSDSDYKNSFAFVILNAAIQYNIVKGYENEMQEIMKIVKKADNIIAFRF